MSIAPPSDIVLDVAQAGDPLRVQAATAKLAAMASGVGAPDIDFTAVLQSHATSTAAKSASAMATSVLPEQYARGHQMATKPGSPYQKFEAVVLQNFMQSILPKDSDLFGDAFSADAYRSMLAEQLSTQVAKSGRLGIAREIEAKENARHHGTTPAVHAASVAIGASASGSAEGALASLVAPKAKTDI